MKNISSLLNEPACQNVDVLTGLTTRIILVYRRFLGRARQEKAERVLESPWLPCSCAAVYKSRGSTRSLIQKHKEGMNVPLAAAAVWWLRLGLRRGEWSG